MARLPRFVIPGYPQYVIVRGNNRMRIFYDDENYHFYLVKLKLACDKCHVDICAYVLMTNHVHLLITPQKEDGLSMAMQIVGRYYVQYFDYGISAHVRFGRGDTRHHLIGPVDYY